MPNWLTCELERTGELDDICLAVYDENNGFFLANLYHKSIFGHLATVILFGALIDDLNLY